MSAHESTTPADRILDLFVFAPAGLALTFVEELPNLIEKGRNRIEGRTATARVVGQFAVQMGVRELSKRARNLIGPDQAHRGAPPRREPRADAPTTGEQENDRTASDYGRLHTEARTELNGYEALGDLAIPAYDTLSASQVVKRLDGLSREELLEVGEHERQNRHRATILAKVEQLLSGEPSLGT